MGAAAVLHARGASQMGRETFRGIHTQSDTVP